MLERKFSEQIVTFFQKQKSITVDSAVGLNGRKIMLVNGARQVGKSYIIRQVGQKLFNHYIEIDLKADSEGARDFERVRSVDDFYIKLGALAGDRLSDRAGTLVFLDEIQAYPHLLTMLKFLNQDGRYTYIASGSQLGVALFNTPSVPLGSVEIQQMYPLDFEEFLWAMGCGKDVIELMEQSYNKGERLSESLHNYMMRMFRYYLLTGGMPDAVNQFVKDQNMALIRTIQTNIHNLYAIDASQYDVAHRLKIRRIYDMIPSNLENKKKRVIVKDIENKKGKQFSDYEEEFEYLVESGIALDVVAISNPHFPLYESVTKSLLKLYLNDVGILTAMLYGNNIDAILQDERSVNLGTVYESVVAQELHAHGNKLHYYDNKKKGEVDFLINDFNSLSVLPIEVKSGKNYKEHSALTHFISNSDYGIKNAIVLCNEREVQVKDGITYLPIYYCMFIGIHTQQSINNLSIPPVPLYN
ncbi:MAG: ATP-binding protein [Paludibacteraceae bacterium]|nr:ATP-binding protein [Paludibacteraceae bacterium]